jgi:hypothetical protein
MGDSRLFGVSLSTGFPLVIEAILSFDIERKNPSDELRAN